MPSAAAAAHATRRMTELEVRTHILAASDCRRQLAHSKASGTFLGLSSVAGDCSVGSPLLSPPSIGAKVVVVPPCVTPSARTTARSTSALRWFERGRRERRCGRSSATRTLLFARKSRHSGITAVHLLCIGTLLSAPIAYSVVPHSSLE